jgi:membrane protein YdbS with pleckstrin-like domain
MNEWMISELLDALFFATNHSITSCSSLNFLWAFIILFLVFLVPAWRKQEYMWHEKHAARWFVGIAYSGVCVLR